MQRYIHIPDTWTPEQAAAVLDFLGHLEELIFDAYEDKLRFLYGTGPPDQKNLETDKQQQGDDFPF